jgi:Dienelactone hydrolase and related enzymes
MKLKEYKNESKRAIIILHEIYGINRHIERICNEYCLKGYDVYCPDLLDRKHSFEYSQCEEAYRYFVNKVSFEVFHQVNILIEQLKKQYEKVILLGFSIGATVAWRCTSNALCDGVIGYYGSRIRDYISVVPKCPTLLLFAEEDSFDVAGVAEVLKNYENVTVEILEGRHGFLDSDSVNYNRKSSNLALELTEKFLSGTGKP